MRCLSLSLLKKNTNTFKECSLLLLLYMYLYWLTDESCTHSCHVDSKTILLYSVLS